MDDVLKIAVELFVFYMENGMKPDVNECLIEAINSRVCYSCEQNKTCIMWGEPDLGMCGYEKMGDGGTNDRN